MKYFWAFASYDYESWEPEATLEQDDANPTICTYKFYAECWAHESMYEIPEANYQSPSYGEGAVIQLNFLESNKDARE